jgi:uncharacterized protein (TIGR03382 family)
MRKPAVLALFVLALLCARAYADGGGTAPIVGGTQVPDGEWPDAVAVLGEDGRCTGTLIAPDVVLTAGHCIDIAPRIVVADTVDVDSTDGEWIRVVRAVAYPDWQASYDVGVLVLERAAQTRPRKVARSCTAREELVAGAAVTVVGFGRTTEIDDGRDRAVTKNAVTIDVTDPACTTDLSCAAAIDPGGEFIAGGDGRDACFGDSGGPAYVETERGPVLLGVVSRGLAGEWTCGHGGVYVRVDKVVRWIERTTERRLPRPYCASASGDDPDDGADELDGGCSAGGGGGGVVVVLALGLVLARRRRRGL